MQARLSPPDAAPSVFFAAAVSPNKIGGLEAFAVELARQLQKHGWGLTMCFQDSPPPGVKDFLLSPGNVSLAVMHEQLGVSFGNAWTFVQLLRKYRPQVLLYTLGGVVRWWPLLAWLMGVQRRVYKDGTSRTAKSYNYIAPWKVRTFMRPLSRSICVSRFVKERSDKEGIISPAKTQVIYNGVKISPNLGEGVAFRTKYGIPFGRVVVLKVSWLVPEKGIDVALRAARRVLDDLEDVHFVFCGDGANRTDYQRLADNLGIAGNVTWTGMIEDLSGSGAFRAADIQIQCSQWHEAFCLAVAEGMRAGLPVVASRMGGLPELIEDGENGYLFDPDSAEELAGAILKLAKDAKLRSQMGAKGRQRAIENHDLARNIELWVNALIGPDI